MGDPGGGGPAAKKGDAETFLAWWDTARPTLRSLFRPPRPVLHVPRSGEAGLVAALTALVGYRQARWRAVLLVGLAGSGKTALAQALAEDGRVRRVFRDGIVWLDGRCDPHAELDRLCLALGLDRPVGERPVECWRRWAGAAERRLLLIVDDAVSAEGVPPLIAGVGPQVVALITTRQGVEVQAEVERWLPADRILVQPVAGLTPAEGRQWAEAVVGHALNDVEWELAQAVGERVGWHPEALRLAAFEGREAGWAGVLGELEAGRLPWSTLGERLLGQWAGLAADRRGWLSALVAGPAAAWFAVEDAARLWGVTAAVARRRLWLLRGSGWVEEADGDPPAWRVARLARLAWGREEQGGETRGNGRQ